MKFPYSNFDILQLRNNTEAANLNNEIILIDNLTSENVAADSLLLDYPIKLSFSISIICLSGAMTFRINLKEHTMKANDMLIVQCGDFGEFLSVSADCKVIVIAFTDEYFRHTQYPEATVSLQRMFHDNPVCSLKQGVVDECVLIYKLMKSKIAETDNPYRKGALMGYLQVLLYDVYFYFENDFNRRESLNKKSSRKEEIFEKFIKTVQKDYREYRDILHYADVLCISPKYLSQIIQQVSGKLAGEWISEYVILEAKALLKSRKYTIQQISDSLNFANQSFFGRYFKERVGCSPTAYQRQE